ncbi:ABC transporter permease [Streptomyces rimosus]|uniref:ABC transporter permease n=1 Tax=Streptomyces rimosus TaxID=1927 RepID=UPI00067B862F|nr:ABC transporter permease [Streptomyces rimosus]
MPNTTETADTAGVLSVMRPPDARSRPGILTELGQLISLQILNWRWTWRTFLVLGTILPVLYGLMLGTALRHSTPGAVSHALIGAVLLSASVDSMGKTSAHFVNLRQTGGLDHLLRLPVRPALLIVSTGAAFCAFALPGIVATIVLDAWLLDVELAVSPLAVLVVPVAVFAYVGIGALIGGLTPTPELASPLSLLVSLTSLGAGAVVLPAPLLPPALQAVGDFNPATYIADALRGVLLPGDHPHLAISVLITCVFTATAVVSAGAWVRRWAA